ncbi:hypothetical protein PM082_008762 [Marasmius tenuissimus]|nr:hypothetical protein PM082_008762 [Marasmius tenuissimus]
MADRNEQRQRLHNEWRLPFTPLEFQGDIHTRRAQRVAFGPREPRNPGTRSSDVGIAIALQLWQALRRKVEGTNFSRSRPKAQLWVS